MVEQVEKDIYEHQYVDYRDCSQTLILPLTQQLREVEAVADRIQMEKAIAESLEHMEEQVENVEVDAAMSVASSNVTLGLDVEPCSRLDPDMKYHGYNPTDEELLSQSLRIDQRIMDQLAELLRKAQQPKKTEIQEATIWFPVSNEETDAD